ncbi:uncharacterized protein RJT21DRAFT_46345 [Scheffersomyces amazonensis]|uniref:uncharacterized protein n=1 Tax=Scheffersomyces amazonensis TaxID=1078765 RepID=UPI00315C96A2
MSTPKLSSQTSQKLMNLLYGAISQEVAVPMLPLITKHLYDNANTSTSSSTKSYMDTLIENDWGFKPMHLAVKDLPLRSNAHIQSNILKFDSINSYITKTDFQHIYPKFRERIYSTPYHREDVLPFEVLKSRNPLTLQFQNSYYLIFLNYIQACTYYNEVRGKSINGSILDNFKFVDPNENELKNLISPYYENTSVDLSLITKDGSNLPISTIFQSNNEEVLSKINGLITIKSNSTANEWTNDDETIPHANYKLLMDLLNADIRSSMVLVRNLPFGLSQHTLPRLLWNYSLVDKYPIVSIVKNPKKQLSLTLIKFKNGESAQRFYRNFHGRKWDKFQHNSPEKQLYEPILCEIIN